MMPRQTTARTIFFAQSRGAWIIALAGLISSLPFSAAPERQARGQEKPAPDPEIAPLFRNLFRALGVPDMRDPNAAEGTARDPVDSRIPKDPQIDAIWKGAQEAVQKQDWKQGTELLQRLLDYPEDAVIEQEPGRWESVRGRASRLMGELPPAALTDYERRFGGLALQLLNEQKVQPDPDKLVEIATRYFHTDAGAMAAALLARWHFDQQEFLLATYWNRDLWARRWSGTRSQGWLLQAAFAARQAGLDDFQTEVASLISDDSMTLVEIGGRRIPAREWWQTARLATPGLPSPVNWQEFGGTAARLSASASGEPLLLPQWSQPLTEVPSVQEKLSSLLRDLRDDQVPAIPATSPVVMGDRVAFRDLRSVRVVDLKSGQTLWQTEEGVSPERILNGIPAQMLDRGNMWRMRVNAERFDDEYQGGAADMHPLSSWLFRDGTNGFLSCDQQRLYVLEDLAVMTRNQTGYGDNGEGDVTDQFGATWASNRLSAYELATGRLVWTIGGPATTESITLPLAGSFFFGVPAIEQDELYVVATSGQEIRLQALDPATGRPRWSQLLAYSDTKIELDVARRWLGAPVAVRDGLIVCPTTVGWVVAVDRTRRCLLWGHRYWPREEAGEMDPAAQFLMQRSLFESWAVGAPIMTGTEVLFAPPDSDSLYCLSLIDGKTLWTSTRDDGLYQAVTKSRQVLVVGLNGVRALSIATGQPDWSLEWESGEYPTGRGCLIGHEYAVPLSTGAVAILDVAEGKITRRLQVPTGQPPLGNLIKAGHLFLSVGPRGCQVYSEKSQFLAELTAGDTTGHDWLVQLRTAEYELLQGQTEQALKRLADSGAGQWPAELQERRRQAQWSGWMTVARAGSTQEIPALEELTRLAQSPDDRFAIEALRISHLIAADDRQGAVRKCLAMAPSPPELSSLTPEPASTKPEPLPKPGVAADLLVARPDNPDIRVQRQVWLAGQLQSLWDSGDETLRQFMISEAQPQLETALQGTVDDCLALLPWIEFHPLAPRLHWKIAESMAAASLFSRAEAELATGCDSAAPEVAAESRLRLARLYTQFGLQAEAVTLVNDVRKAAADLTLSNGLTVPAAIEQWKLPVELETPVSAAAAVRQHQQLAGVRSSASYLPQQQEVIPPLDRPYFAQLSMQIEPQEQRLTIQSRETGHWLWMAPLRSVARAEHSGYSPCQFLGHRIVVLHRDVLQVLSPVRQELAWATSSGEDRHEVDNAHRPMVQSLVDTGSLENESVFWTFRQMHNGRLAVCNNRAIGVTGRRRLSVYDPVTGALRWTHDNLPADAFVFGAGRLILTVNSDSEPIAYDALDGRRLELPQEIVTSFAQTLALVGENVIQFDRKAGIRLFNVTTGGVTIRSRDVLTAQEQWKQDLPAGTWISLLDKEHLIAVGPSSRATGNKHSVEVIDLTTGEKQSFAGLPGFRQEESLTAIQDRERLYLIVNHGYSGGYSYGDSLPSTRVHGSIVAWDRASGQLQWQRKVQNQNLSIDRFDSSPVLLFLARNWKQVGQATYTTLQLMALSKETGEILHDSTTPSLFSGFHGIQIIAPGDEIELLSYNQKLRLVPATK